MIDPERLYRNAEVAEILQQRPTTIITWRSHGRGPRYMKVGRVVFIKGQWLIDFLAASERDPTDKSAMVETASPKPAKVRARRRPSEAGARP